MPKKTLNQVLAENLKAQMGDKWVQKTLAAASGIGQTTISLYLNPDRRKSGATGKAPSAKLSEVERLAAALGCSPLTLLTDKSAAVISPELMDKLATLGNEDRLRIEDVLRGALAMTVLAARAPAQETAALAA